MKTILKKLLPHIGIIILFIIISLAFFHPVLQGKKIFQSDIAQYTAMAKERNDIRKNQNKETYWTDSAFGGMPTYQLGANYPYDFIKKLDKIIRFLPRPSDYLFLYFIGFYILMLVLKIDYKTAFIGSIAFGFSTYLIIILGVGHNAKAHAIGYFAPILAGILLTFNKRYILGGLLTTIATALEIQANHYQMTFYLLILVLILGISKFISAVQSKTLPLFLKSISILLVSGILAISVNATPLLTTMEYAKFSTRGKSELTLTPEGIQKPTTNGLSKDYITEYSYGITESLNLIVPRLFGGSNHENLGQDSKTYNFLIQNGVPVSQALEFSKSLPTYWGNQPIVAAPAYIGIIVFFFFIMALFLVKRKQKWWILVGIIISLLLSWGKNFNLLTNFMIDYFPMYSKFRAVSSIQVILELCIPILAFLGLYEFFKSNNEKRMKVLLKSSGIIFGILITLWIFKGVFSFTGTNDELYRQFYGEDIVNIIQSDRKALYTKDIIRSLSLTLITFITLWLFTKQKLTRPITLLTLLGIISLDMIGFAKNYVNSDNFVASREINHPFQITQADKEILKDKSRYRVFEPEVGLNGARTSFFHHSIGGYHAAKPKRIQELFDYQIAHNNNFKVLDMLNVKYIISRNKQGQKYVNTNNEALGNVWFIKTIKDAKNDDEAMQMLTNFNPKNEAIIINSSEELSSKNYILSENATIKLVSSEPDKLIYESNNPNDGFAVFSEIYYPEGWKVFIDNQQIYPIYRVNYTLRGLAIPKGKHTITFEFKPKIITIGSYISLIGNIILILLLLGALIYFFQRKMNVKL